MRRLLFALLTLWWAATSSYAVTPPFEQARSLGFLLQRGGIRVDVPYRKGNYWYLPITCNVSGIKTISNTPSVIHSGLAWSKSVAEISGDRIIVTVFTAQQGTQAPSAQCGPARLARYSGSAHTVYYRDPDGTEHRLEYDERQ